MYNYSLQNFQWFSLACRCGKICSLYPGKKIFSQLLQNRILTDFNLLLPFLQHLATHGKETISFLNINQKWSQGTDFASRSKFGAVQIRPDILGLGPGRVLLVKQFDICSSGKLPSLGAQPLPAQGHPRLWPSAAESSPAAPACSEAPACRYCC